MSVISLFIIAISLSFDTFAVSVSCGIMAFNIRFRQAIRIAVIFAVFQAFMPLIGWYLGYSIRDYIVAIDHWLAFGLLFLIGAKMIYESFKEDDTPCFSPKNYRIILSMALATTIDAFIVGISFAFIEVNIVLAMVIIACITFFAAMLGMLFGKKIGNKLGRKMEFIGGVVLFIIGLKILVEHLGFL